MICPECKSKVSKVFYKHLDEWERCCKCGHEKQVRPLGKFDFEFKYGEVLECR